MKKLIFLTLMLTATCAFAAEKTKEEWHNTTLSDDTIKHIQHAKTKYMQCISTEAQNQIYTKMDSRLATDKILKQCETQLANIRQVFIDEKVPPTIIDRYMKQIRNQTSRNVLKEMMFAEAARKSGQ